MIVVATSIMAVVGLYRAACLTGAGVTSAPRRPRTRQYRVVAAQQPTLSDDNVAADFNLDETNLPAIS